MQGLESTNIGEAKESPITATTFHSVLSAGFLWELVATRTEPCHFCGTGPDETADRSWGIYQTQAMILKSPTDDSVEEID